jgi:ketosteroid isomerase-like protein/acetyl esterase/lipase
MSESAPQDSIAVKTVVYHAPGEDAVTVRRDVEYTAADGTALPMDIYYPPGHTNEAPAPAVVIVAGYPDAGFERMLGRRFKDMGSSVSWGRLLAASGMAAIAYANREPEADLHAAVRHVRENAAALGIDGERVGVWASSGNVPLALSLLMREGTEFLRCAALCYGFTLDLGGSTVVAEAAETYKFAYPCAGKSVDDLPERLPVFVARAGRDQVPGLNHALDRFVLAALARDMPVTLANHAEGQHAFDLLDDGDATREIVRQVIDFMRFHLVGPTASAGETERVARELIARFDAGDLAGALDMLADDVNWWIVGRQETQPAAGDHDREQITRLLRTMGSRLKNGLRMKVKGTVAEGDRAALEIESHGELDNGRVYNNQYHMLVRVRDGKIAEVREYLDTQHVAATWFEP